ncbi:MAG: hypothetical protein J5944_15155 [Lentisphaeria bacterium]|nr:hypothetical protein [Lentisphaeria bacterium]
MMNKKPDFEAIRQKLKPIVGPPSFPGGKNRQPVLNQQWVAALCKEVCEPIYDKASGSFYIYNPDNGLWESQTIQEMLTLISELMMQYANACGDSFVDSKRDAATIKHVLEFLKANCSEEDAFRRGKTPFIHCGNGVIEFRDQEDGRVKPVLMPFDPKYRSRNRTEFNYDPNAKYPDFIERLLKPALSEDSINHLQLYGAQCLLGENNSQTILLMTGTANGGKSTIVNIIEKVVNRKNCTELRLEHMNTRFETQRLVGKTLLTAKDVASSFLNSAGAHRLKALTGKDTITIEHKGSNETADICGTFNVIITANNTLRVAVDGDADAWRRRIIVLPFEKQPPREKIANYDDVLLKKEGPGILCWLVEGAVLLLENNGQIPKSDIQKALVDALLHESEPLSEFINTCIEPDDKGTVTTAELLEGFRAFCTKRNWLLLPQRYIENNLPEYIYRAFGLSKRTDIKRNGRNNRGYYGLRLKNV